MARKKKKGRSRKANGKERSPKKKLSEVVQDLLLKGLVQLKSPKTFQLLANSYNSYI